MEESEKDRLNQKLMSILNGDDISDSETLPKQKEKVLLDFDIEIMNWMSDQKKQGRRQEQLEKVAKCLNERILDSMKNGWEKLKLRKKTQHGVFEVKLETKEKPTNDLKSDSEKKKRQTLRLCRLRIVKPLLLLITPKKVVTASSRLKLIC